MPVRIKLLLILCHVSAVFHPFRFQVRWITTSSLIIRKLMKSLSKWKKRKSGLILLDVKFHNVFLTCDVSSDNPRPYIPYTLRKEVFEQVHNLSHAGVKPTIKLIKKSFIWPSITKDVQIFWKSCIPCQKTKVQKHNKSAFQPISTPNSQFEHVHIDIVGPLPSSEGFTY